MADVNFIKRFKPTKVKAKRERGRPCNGISTSSLGQYCITTQLSAVVYKLFLFVQRELLLVSCYPFACDQLMALDVILRKVFFYNLQRRSR